MTWEVIRKENINSFKETDIILEADGQIYKLQKHEKHANTRIELGNMVDRGATALYNLQFIFICLLKYQLSSPDKLTHLVNSFVKRQGWYKSFSGRFIKFQYTIAM